MTNNFFWTSFRLEVINELPGFTREKFFLPKIFQNNFSFVRKAVSLAISKEVEAMPNGAYV